LSNAYPQKTALNEPNYVCDVGFVEIRVTDCNFVDEFHKIYKGSIGR
jgi:hypothetical protein